ncbi:MAG: cytochrome C [Ignavibacterium sp.]|jgi:hypothetical protein|uniref:cytochrome c3 family protein n=1 Tax=Ignavibacterium sp. TaxID=2651167 RepID=UPI003296EFA8
MKKIKYTYSFLSVAVIMFLLIAAFQKGTSETENPNEGKIKFSHSLHSELVDCQTCHSAVVESTSLKTLQLPNHDNCSTCHSVDNEEECKTCHINDVYEPLVRKKSELIFDHSFHLNNTTMNCETCHQGLKEVDYSWQAVGVNPPMENCYSCHNDKSIASNACESCHISTANLLPQNHKVANFTRNHKFMANAVDANCVMCHDNQSCNDCHVATNVITEVNLNNDFYQPYYPSNFTDGTKLQAIRRVHDLNYRFTHGMESKGKTAECQSCHQIETFCANCHASENTDFAVSGIIPASHLKPNFFTIGVGTGGGEHAILARRDIERCTSCHDVNGSDPTCITCHLDSDGIKGTNPKTHARGFMKNEKGDWHDSEGSVCYNCHTSASPSSQKTAGFCNYCHGL